MKIAVPSDNPGGLDAKISNHFGHCDAFTTVELNDGQIGEVKVVPNGGHEAGGCMAPVMVLKEAGVNALVAGGMGARPLAGLQQQGIEVYFNEGAATVDQALNLVAKGQSRVFSPAQVCGGGGDCGGHGHDHGHACK